MRGRPQSVASCDEDVVQRFECGGRLADLHQVLSLAERILRLGEVGGHGGAGADTRGWTWVRRVDEQQRVSDSPVGSGCSASAPVRRGGPSLSALCASVDAVTAAAATPPHAHRPSLLRAPRSSTDLWCGAVATQRHDRPAVTGRAARKAEREKRLTDEERYGSREKQRG